MIGRAASWTQRLSSVDKVVVGYLLLTGLMISFHSERLGTWEWHLGVRVAILGGILLLRPRVNGSARILRFALDWYPVVLFPVLYKEVETLAAAFGDWSFTEKVRQWEVILWGDFPSDFLSVGWPSPLLSEYLHACYLSYLVLIPAVGAYFYFRGRRPAFHHLILAVSWTFCLSYIFYILYPVDSPFYLSEPLDETLSSQVLYRTVHFFSERGGARGGAFPSSHVSISTVVWLVSWRWDRKLAWLMTLVVPGIYLATVYGRFHYLLDVLAGWLLAVAVILVLSRGKGPSGSESGEDLSAEYGRCSDFAA